MTEYAFDESLKKVLAELDKLPAKIETNVARAAIRAAAKPFLDAARENAPVSSGRLRDSIRISSNTDKRGGMLTASVKAGRTTTKAQRAKGVQDAYYAYMVEFGTKPHLIKGPVKLGGQWYKNIHHPGSPPSGFMRRAFDSRQKASFDAYADYMRKRIPKELAKNGGG